MDRCAVRACPLSRNLAALLQVAAPEHTGLLNVTRILPVTLNSIANDRTGEGLQVSTQDSGVTASIHNSVTNGTTITITTPTSLKRKHNASSSSSPPPVWAIKKAADIHLNLRPDPYATKKQMLARERTIRHTIARKIQMLNRKGKRAKERAGKEDKLMHATEHSISQPQWKANKLTNIIGPSAPTEQPHIEVVILPSVLEWDFNYTNPPSTPDVTPTSPYLYLDKYTESSPEFPQFDYTKEEGDTCPQTPTVHEPVRATSTRFKQYLSRAIDERQMIRQRLLSNPKSAPARHEQKRRRQWARGQERYTKAFKHIQDALPVAISSPLSYTRHQIRKAKECLQRFVVFLQARMANKRAQDAKEVYDPNSENTSDADASSCDSYRSWRSDRRRVNEKGDRAFNFG